MSLKQLADELAARGRNGDTELVHMSKGEVAGLQGLAQAAGGSLTINPETGKPEAFFLAALLPTILGGVGASMGLGALGTAALGAGVGALTNKKNPLMGAIMGGMGGMGGGNIANALGAAGATNTAAQAITNPAVTNALAGQAIGTGGTSQAAMLAAQNAGFGADGVKLLSQAAGGQAPSAMSQLGNGIMSLGGEQGRGAFMNAIGGGKGLMRSGMLGAAPLAYGYMSQTPKQPGEYEDTEDLMGRYTYNAGYTGGEYEPGSAYTGERRYFRPTYTRNYAEGGETAEAPAFDPARGMTGASAEAMRYLYGMQDQSPALQARMQTPVATELPTAPASQKYIFDPSSQKFLNNPAYVDPARNRFAGILGAAGTVFGGDHFSTNYNGDSSTWSGMSYNPDYSVPVTDRSDWSGVGGSYESGSGGYDSYGGGYDSYGGYDGPASNWAQGGITSLARSGLKSGGFVIPADAVSMAGEGNTEAGYDRIAKAIPGAVPIKGKDGGQADTVATSIEGKQPARVAHGEMYVPPAAVKRAGGAKKLYAMMNNVRKQATGRKAQIKPVNLKKAMA
jgi:hypothetical protein